MQPINKYIVVKDIDEEVMTESGLLLSGEDMDKMRYCKATVIKPGTEVKVVSDGDVIRNRFSEKTTNVYPLGYDKYAKFIYPGNNNKIYL